MFQVLNIAETLYSNLEWASRSSVGFRVGKRIELLEHVLNLKYKLLFQAWTARSTVGFIIEGWEVVKSWNIVESWNITVLRVLNLAKNSKAQKVSKDANPKSYEPL